VTHYRESFYKKLLLGKEYLLVSSFSTQNSGRASLNKKILPNHKIVPCKEKFVFGINFCYQKGVVKLLSCFNPEVVVVLGLSSYISNWFVLFWAKLFNKKIIIWSSGWERLTDSPILLFFKKNINKVYYNFADFILVYSTSGEKYLRTFIKSKNIVVCYNGIEIDEKLKLYEQIIIKANKINAKFNNKKIYLYVGGMLKEKKVDLLIESFDLLSYEFQDTILLLIGDGPDIEDFKKISKNNNIYFLGRVVDEVDQYFKACNFFVLPGLGGLALNEAMFWGKPCIVSKADGTENDLIDDGVTGFRFEENNKLSLFNAMKKSYLLNDYEYSLFSEQCHKIIIQKSNVSAMVEKFNMTIFGELL